MQDKLTPEVADKDVTVRRIFDTKEDIPESRKGNNYALTKRDVIVSLISYAVGCMFGRYSLDVPGLAYAVGTWDGSKYTTFQPDKDAILPFCDDEYFENDIVVRFMQFIEVVYGKETQEENLRFIAHAQADERVRLKKRLSSLQAQAEETAHEFQKMGLTVENIARAVNVSADVVRNWLSEPQVTPTK